MASPLIWVLPQVLISVRSDFDPDTAIFLFDWSKALAILIGVCFLATRAFYLRQGGLLQELGAWFAGLLSGLIFSVAAIGVSFAIMLGS